MTESSSQPRRDNRSGMEWFLGLFAEVKAGEGAAVLLLFANIFLILTAYYVLKVVREQLTIAGVSVFGIEGAEVKAYLPAVMAVLLTAIIPAYGLLASKVDRLRLIKLTSGFVIASLLVFWAWGRAVGVGTAIGLTFYIWLGIVNVFLIAQFWSFANDVYSETQGKRLFAIIAIGQSAGAILGPQIAKLGAGAVFELPLACAAIFFVCIVLYSRVNARGAGGEEQTSSDDSKNPLEKDGGFALVFRTRYLLLIALMILTTNVVNTTGEYILASAASSKSEREIPTLAVAKASLDENKVGLAEARTAAEGVTPVRTEDLPEADRQTMKKARGAVIGAFYGDFFSIVNLVGLLIQMFLVSRIFKYFGVRAALFVLPVISLGGYAAIGVVGGLIILRVAKTAENATDYSLQNTVKQALFLPTSREAKYKAKAAIDTFFVRFGDAASAGIVAIGIHVLAFGSRQFALVNVALAVVWILLNVGIAREHKKMVPDDTLEDLKK